MKKLPQNLKVNILNLQECSHCGSKFDATIHRKGTTTICTKCQTPQSLISRLIQPPRIEYFAFWLYKGYPKIGLNNFKCEYHNPNDLDWIRANYNRLDILRTKADLEKIYRRNHGVDSAHNTTPMFFKKIIWDLADENIVSISNDIEPDVLHKLIFNGIKET